MARFFGDGVGRGEEVGDGDEGGRLEGALLRVGIMSQTNCSVIYM